MGDAGKEMSPEAVPLSDFTEKVVYGIGKDPDGSQVLSSLVGYTRVIEQGV